MYNPPLMPKTWPVMYDDFSDDDLEEDFEDNFVEEQNNAPEEFLILQVHFLIYSQAFHYPF